MKKIEQSLKEMWDTIKDTNICIKWEYQKWIERERSKNNLQRDNDWKCPKFLENIYLHTQEF